MSTQVVFTGTAKNDLREIAVHLGKTVRQPGACRPLCPGAAGADGDPGAVPGIRRIPAGPDAEEQRLPFSDAQGLSAVLPVRKGRGSGLYHGHFPRQARLPARHAAISVT